MEEIDLQELLKYFTKKISVVILTVILALLLGYAYVEFFQVPMYKGTTTIILVEKSDNRVSNLLTQNEISVNEKLVATYSEVIKSKRVLNRVINDLKLKTSIEELKEIIGVSSVQDTSIIEISVTDKKNVKATAIANKIAEIFKEEIVKIYNLENVSIIDEATIEEEPYNINLPVQFLIYAAIGFVFSLFIIFAMFYFNKSIGTKQEVESKLNIPVLGEVPITNMLKKKKHKVNNRDNGNNGLKINKKIKSTARDELTNKSKTTKIKTKNNEKNTKSKKSTKGQTTVKKQKSTQNTTKIKTKKEGE